MSRWAPWDDPIVIVREQNQLISYSVVHTKQENAEDKIKR